MTGFYDRFTAAADRFGEHTAVEVQRREGLESWTYGRLRAKADALASSLWAGGLRPGDRCALLSENDALWCAAYLAILRIGAAAVPLDTTYTPEQIARIVADCGARMIVVSPRFFEKLQQIPDASACPAFALQLEDEPAGTDPPVPAVVADEPAAILYTSGTTSDPKGVVLTQGNLVGEIDAATNVITIHEGDAILGVLPLFHALALVANLMIPLSVGARVVFLETVSSGDLMRALRERGITVFCCVPQFFYLIHQRVMEQVAQAGRIKRFVFGAMLQTAGLLRERLGINLGPRLFGRVHGALGPRMRLLLTGGSRFDPRIGRDLYRLGFNILQAYGLTETCGGATVLRPDDKHIGSVGQALPSVEIKIVPNELVEGGESGDGPGRVGEIVIRGPVVSPGYYRREDVNAVTFRDGWLHTGDLGYLDEAGRVYITGRAKEMIVLGSGKNIYPEEIEAHYLASPFIKELCVMGRTLPDQPASERLHAVVVPDFEVLRERKIFNSREIVRYEIESLSARLPGHKRILSYDIVTEDLPRTTTRKLKRFEIEKRLGQMQQEGPPSVTPDTPPTVDADATWAADPQVARILEVLRETAAGSPALRRESSLELDLGLDSMGRVELLAALEARFGHSIPDEVAHEIHTIGELVEAFGPAAAAAVADAGGDFDPWRDLLDDVSEEDPAVSRILVARPWVSRLLFAVAKMLHAAAWLLLGLRVSGRENLPERGPFLISPNHQSYLDGFLLAAVLPFRVFRDVFYVGESEYFRSPISAWFARLIHIIPVDPDSNLVRAMRAGAHGLRRGKALILFPEGERSIDSEVKRFKKGAAVLSLKVGAPIVPVALDGLFEIWPRARMPRLSKLVPFFGARTRIRFGAPLEPASKPLHADVDYASHTRRLREAVESLLNGLRNRS